MFRQPQVFQRISPRVDHRMRLAISKVLARPRLPTVQHRTRQESQNQKRSALRSFDQLVSIPLPVASRHLVYLHVRRVEIRTAVRNPSPVLTWKYVLEK
jgi:hypothetical protein